MQILDYFYTEQQAAKILAVNRITIWRWIKDGKFTSQQVGREVLIPKWEIELIKQTRTLKPGIDNNGNN
jgi:excisionase family DNA binding protein